MLALLKLLQSVFSTLHSEGTPRQVAAGLALGAALGLTPLVNPHNLVVFALLCLLNVSFAGGMLGWALFTPLGFLLDPIFHRIGLALLETARFRPFWTALYNAPVVPYANFNNSVVLGSFLSWLVLLLPIYLGARIGVVTYRERYAPRVEQSRLYRAITATKLYNIYRWFRPE
jgi:uncharacterized protein (TIGR03546 family)